MTWSLRIFKPKAIFCPDAGQRCWQHADLLWTAGRCCLLVPGFGRQSWWCTFTAQAAAAKASTWASYCGMRMGFGTTGVTAATLDACRQHLLKLLSEMRSRASFLLRWITPCNYDKVTSTAEWDLGGYLASGTELELFPSCRFLSLQKPYSVVKSSGQQRASRAGTVWLKTIAVIQDIAHRAEWMQNLRAEAALLECAFSQQARVFTAMWC